MSLWGAAIEKERRNRILVQLWAYAYEMQSDSLVEDEVFDAVCISINPKVKTGNSEMDKFFRQQFVPCTGMWIWDLPKKYLDKLAQIYVLLTESELTQQQEQ